MLSSLPSVSSRCACLLGTALLLFTGSVTALAQQKTDSAVAIEPVATVPPLPHVYRMNYWVSGSLAAVTTAGNLYAIPRFKNKEQLTDAELAAVNSKTLSFFDRWALNQDPTQAQRFDKASDRVMQGTIAATAALLFDKKVRKEGLRLLMMYYETHAITFTMYNYSFFGPAFQNKLRPNVYYPSIPEEQRREGNSRNSFYSGHVASATASTFFVAKVYSDLHPELGKKKYLLYGLASLPPMAMGYYRVKALKHFPSDVMVGYMIGATCGIVVPELHKFRRRHLELGVSSTDFGPAMSVCWRPQPARWERKLALAR